jgi:molybdopterin converting factor small subunit
MDHTNAERQRRYIARLKAKAAGAVLTEDAKAQGDEVARLKTKLAELKAQFARERAEHKNTREVLGYTESRASEAAVQARIVDLESREAALAGRNRDLEAKLATAEAKFRETLHEPITVNLSGDREIANLKAALTAKDAEIEKLKKRAAELEAAPAQSTADKDKIAELENAIKMTRRGFIWTMKQYRDVEYCTHPDRIAHLKDKDLSARFDTAFRVVKSSKGILVDVRAEEDQRRRDKLTDDGREHIAEVLRKRLEKDVADRAKAKARYEARKAAASKGRKVAEAQ